RASFLAGRLTPTQEQAGAGRVDKDDAAPRSSQFGCLAASHPSRGYHHGYRRAPHPRHFARKYRNPSPCQERLRAERGNLDRREGKEITCLIERCKEGDTHSAIRACI